MNQIFISDVVKYPIFLKKHHGTRSDSIFYEISYKDIIKIYKSFQCKERFS